VRLSSVIRVIASAVVVAGGLLGSVPAGAIAPTVAPAEVVAGGGVGDGGPESAALINAAAIVRTATGDFYFYDYVTHQIRFYDHTSGIVTAVYGTAYKGDPAPFWGQFPADAKTVRLPDISKMWVSTDGYLWYSSVVRSFSAFTEHDVARINLTSGVLDVATKGVDDPTACPTGNSDIQNVRSDGSVVIVRECLGANSGFQVEVLPAAASASTAATLWGSLTRVPTDVASAADGTLYVASGAGIWQLSAPNALTLVAGTDGYAPSYTTPRTNDVLALGAVMAPWALTVDPSGAVLYLDQYEIVNPTPSTVGVVRRFVVGGNVKSATSEWNGYFSSSMSTDDNFLYTVGQTVQKWPLDGSGASGTGTAFLGTSTTAGASPDGTDATKAWFGDSTLFTVDPAGNAYVATYNRIFEIVKGASSRTIKHFAGSGGATAAPVDNVQAVDETIVPTALAAASDGTVYFVDNRLNSSWPAPGQVLLRSVSPSGVITTLSGSTTDPVVDGAAAAATSFWATQIFVSPNGQTLYAFDTSSSDSTAVIWTLDLATKHWHRFVGGGNAAVSDGAQGSTVRLPAAPMLGLDAAGKVYVMAGDGVYNVTADGVMHKPTNSDAPDASGVAPDGSLYQLTNGRIFRTALDGSTAPVYGTIDNRDAPLGGPVHSLRIVVAADGSIWGEDKTGFSEQLWRIATPSPVAWPSAQPTIHVSIVGGHFVITGTKPITPWPVEYSFYLQPGTTPVGGLPASSSPWEITDHLPAAVGTFKVDQATVDQVYYPPVKGQFYSATLFMYSQTVPSGIAPVFDTVDYPPNPVASTISITTNYAHPTSGAKIEIYGYLKDPAPVTGASVIITVKDLVTGKSIKSVSNTDSAGKYRGFALMTHSVQATASFAGDASDKPATSKTIKVLVSPLVTVTSAPTSVKVKAAAVFRGGVSPVNSAKTISLQRLVGKKWVDLAKGTVTSNGKFVITWKPAAKGTYVVRAHTAVSATFGEGISATKKVTVR
jgi:hypothetical protein